MKLSEELTPCKLRLSLKLLQSLTSCSGRWQMPEKTSATSLQNQAAQHMQLLSRRQSVRFFLGEESCPWAMLCLGGTLLRDPRPIVKLQQLFGVSTRPNQLPALNSPAFASHRHPGSLESFVQSAPATLWLTLSLAPGEAHHSCM